MNEWRPVANNLGPLGFDIDINNTAGPVSETRQFDFTVAAGGSFYVWAYMVGTADNPGEVDASSTLTASLTNTLGLSTGGSAAGPQVPGLGLIASITAVALLMILGAFFARHRSLPGQD